MKRILCRALILAVNTALSLGMVLLMPLNNALNYLYDVNDREVLKRHARKRNVR